MFEDTPVQHAFHFEFKDLTRSATIIGSGRQMVRAHLKGNDAKYSTRNKCEFWQTEPDAMQGGECAAVRALQAGANAAARRLWQPKTHLFMGEYLDQHHARYQ
jgi:hypothetical protein